MTDPGTAPRASEARRFDYHLDAENLITYVSPDFLAFARENDTPQLTAGTLLNQPIWTFVAGAATREVYATLFDRVRATGQAVTIPFRCDGPTCRRFMELTVSPGPAAALHLSARLLRVEDGVNLPLLDPRIPRSGKMLEACSFCKSIRLPDNGWHPVEDAVRQLSLFDSPQLPILSHSVCPTCMPDFMDRLET